MLSQRARALALRGDQDGCARTVGAAFREFYKSDAESDEWAQYATAAYLSMESGARWMELRRPERAVPIFERALLDWPADQRRDRGLCQTRLAIAYADRGDRARSVEVGGQAVGTARAATSTRTLRELIRLDEKLARWRPNTKVSELHSLIRGLAETA